MAVSANRHLKYFLRGAALAFSATWALTAGKADAVLIYEFIQNGPNVDFKVSGSLSGLPTPFATGVPDCNPGAVVRPEMGFICTYGLTPTNTNIYSISLDVGTDAFGTPPGDVFSYTGSQVYLFGAAFNFGLPFAYVQGAQLTGTGVFSGTTLAALGISSSGLLTRWAIGTDFIDIYSGPAPQPSAVPGPLPLFGAAAAFAHSRRLRARVRASSSMRS